MNSEISVELQLVLSKLCNELQLFLNKTESSLFLAQEKFNQVENVLKPWEILDYYDLAKEKCICKTSNIQITENNEESDLLNTISKTLSSAELIRKKSFKTNVSLNKLPSKINSRRLSESISKNKIKSVSALKDEHSPCCPLFMTSHDLTAKQTFFKLSDAITFHKIPPVLTQTIKHSNKILLCRETSKSSVKCNYKHIFFKNLEAQIDEYCFLQQENDSSIGTFLIYISSLNSYEKKRRNMNRDTWIFYKNVESLKTLHSSRFQIITKESWIIIFNLITNELTTVLLECTQNRKQKLHLFKILKTICNFVYSNVPSVPIFNMQIKTTGG